MKYQYILVWTLSIGMLFSCEQEDLSTLENETAVVSAYLFAGQRVDSIQVSRSISYTNPDTSFGTLDDLEISIEGEGGNFLLESIGNGYYRNPNLSITAGKDYSLSFNFQGAEISAETYVPEKPKASISEQTIYMQKIEGFPRGGFTILDPIEITWDNPAGDYYYVLVENLEVEPEYVNTIFEQFGELIRGIRIRSEPEITDLHIINPMQTLTQFGTYRIIVYRVQPEYASLFTLGNNNNSLTLVEPPSNVNNGLGIFTGVSTDTVFLEVVKQ